MVALGYELYGSCAVNLVMSLKAYEPTIKVCLVHDQKAIAHLNEKERALFDMFSIADTLDYVIDGKPQYQRMKLCAYKYSPFENSLYIDVDTLWFPKKKVTDLIAHLQFFDFYIGKNAEYKSGARNNSMNYTYWEDPSRICRYYKLINPMPQTISGVFWFRKCEFCDKLFARCLEIYNDKKAPCKKWANGKPDEFCFNVALSEMNYQQQNSHIVYFDKTNGIIKREQMYANFWGMAAGGNRLSLQLRELYNDLVEIFHKAFDIGIVRRHIDKVVMISERRNF